MPFDLCFRVGLGFPYPNCGNSHASCISKVSGIPLSLSFFHMRFLSRGGSGLRA